MTTKMTLANGNSHIIPVNATALPVINLQLICATDIRVKSNSNSNIHTHHIISAWDTRQVFQDYYKSLHIGVVKPTLTFEERLDGMDSLMDHHPDVATMCNLTSPMTMLTLLLEGYYYDNDDDDSASQGSASSTTSMHAHVNASSVKKWVTEHVCENILLWQAAVHTHTGSGTAFSTVHNSYTHNPFEMCELQEMMANQNSRELGVPLIFGLLVGLFMCGMLTHAALPGNGGTSTRLSRSSTNNRRHYTFASTSEMDLDMEMTTRRSSTLATNTTNDDDGSDDDSDDPPGGSSIFDEAIRPID
jgi:hypothetical protein